MSSVSMVQCPGQPDLDISAATGAYVPMTATIDVNDIVRFTPGDPGHDMVSGTQPNADGLFDTVAGDTVCLRFSAAGTFPFFCQVHGFTGTLTVQ
jgi:plastocyanin